MPSPSSCLSKGIFLDYASTTPLDPGVLSVMVDCLRDPAFFGNPASEHGFGKKAYQAVEQARDRLAGLIGAELHEIIWTSGATESVNLALKGSLARFEGQAAHIITSSIEHKAVLEVCAYLETKRFKVSYITPDRNGMIQPQQLLDTITPQTRLISLTHVNNETGTLLDVQEIGKIAHSRNILFHLDASQSLARVPLDVSCLRVDLVSFSGHKIYGPKGIGALYIRGSSVAELCPQIHGGFQEQGLRSGTLATHQIMAMGKAAEIIGKRLEEDHAQNTYLETRFMEQLQQALPEPQAVQRNVEKACTVPGILNLHFPGVESKSLTLALGSLMFSAGSACASNEVAPSHVLRGLGLSDQRAHCSVRLSLGRFTTEAEIDTAARALGRTVELLGRMGRMGRMGREPNTRPNTTQLTQPTRHGT